MRTAGAFAALAFAPNALAFDVVPATPSRLSQPLAATMATAPADAGAKATVDAGAISLVRRQRRDDLHHVRDATAAAPTTDEIALRFDFGAIGRLGAWPHAIEIIGETDPASRNAPDKENSADRKPKKAKLRGLGINLSWASQFGETTFSAGRRTIKGVSPARSDAKTRLIHGVELNHGDRHEGLSYTIGLGARHGPDIDDTITGSGVRIGLAGELTVDPAEMPRLDLRAGFGHWRSSADLLDSKSIATTWAVDGSIDFGPMLAPSGSSRAPRVFIGFGANGGHGDDDLDHANVGFRLGIGAIWRF